MIATVLGHAVLITPPAMNSNPTTLQVCGVTTTPDATTSVPALWKVGSTVTVSWRLVAGDGGNAVDAFLSLNGGALKTDSNFTVTLTKGAAIGTQTGVNYDVSFVVPDVKCNPLCTFRVNSNTNWNSCAYVNITKCADCPPPPPPQPKCTTVTAPLDFCKSKNGQRVLINQGSSAAAANAEAKNAMTAYLANPLVFFNGASQVCKDLFSEFICGVNLPPCAGSEGGVAVGTVCRTQCKKVMAPTACNLTEYHKSLYDCEDTTVFPALCPGEKASSASFVSFPLFALVAFVIAALVM